MDPHCHFVTDDGFFCMAQTPVTCGLENCISSPKFSDIDGVCNDYCNLAGSVKFSTSSSILSHHVVSSKKRHTGLIWVILFQLVPKNHHLKIIISARFKCIFIKKSFNFGEILSLSIGMLFCEVWSCKIVELVCTILQHHPRINLGISGQIVKYNEIRLCQSKCAKCAN